MSTKEIKSAAGWQLAHHTMTYESVSDAELYKPDSIHGNVAAYKAKGSDKPSWVNLGASASGFELSTHMTPGRARKLAAALIFAADICEQFEAQQTEVQS